MSAQTPRRGPTTRSNGGTPTLTMRRRAEELLRAGGCTPEMAFSLALDNVFAARGPSAALDKELVRARAGELCDGSTADAAFASALEAFLADEEGFRRQHGGRLGTPPPPPRQAPPIDASALMTRAERPAMNSPVASRRHVEEAEAMQVGEEVDDDEDDESESAGDFDPYLFMKHLPPKAAAGREGWDAAHPRLAPRRPDDGRRPVTLVLDLDETLVHSQMEPRADADFVFDVQLCGVTSTVYVKARPHLNSFLDFAAERFEVVIFTASHEAYAETLLDRIDPRRNRIDHRLFRDACATVDGLYLKDLDVLGRDLAKVAIVDNTPYVFGFQPDNAIPIESWYDDPDDTELEKLKGLLEQLRSAADVRPALVDAFAMRRRIEEAEADGPAPSPFA